jgi:two-component system sensor histidine kinase SenX3
VTVLWGLLGGVAAGLALGYVLWRAALRPDPEPVTVPAATDDKASLARRAIEVMGLGVVVVDLTNAVVIANHAAVDLGVIEDGKVQTILLRLVRKARHDNTAQVREMELPADGLPTPVPVRAEAHPLGSSGHVALLIADLTEARRVEAVRRDFVANVSHELKTPVGALALLAEAVVEGYDSDPEAVRRFADRMRHESSRLARLVQELIDLSRLQGADPLPDPLPVPVDRIVTEVLDRARLAAEAKSIALVADVGRGLTLRGSESQLITALGGLVENAIAYSPEHTTVKVAARVAAKDGPEPVRAEGITKVVTPAVDLSVTDQGIGIADKDLGRIFERFYRADQARSRSTGGTGLGLAIVKHIATNHGGSVRVWSAEGVGSTFTLRLPANQVAPPIPRAGAAPDPAVPAAEPRGHV